MNNGPNVKRILRGLSDARPEIELLANGCITIVLRMQRMRFESASIELEGLTLRMNG